VSERAGPARTGAIVAAVFLALVAVGAVWLAIDRRPPEWDYASHLEHALRCRRDLAARDFAAAFGHSSFYPPLVPCAAGLVYGLLPSDVAFGEVVMFAFLGLGMAATCALARPLAGDAGAVVAAVVFGTAPVVVQHALHFQLDVPLAAVVATFLALLRTTGYFERAGRTLLAGVVFGLGLLVKPPFVVFVAPACLLVAAGARSRRAWLHAAAAALVAVVFAWPWYGPRALGLATQIGNRSFKQAADTGMPAALSSTSLAYYPLNFPAQFGVVAVVLLLVGSIVVLWRRCGYVLAGLSPLVVFFLIQNKQMRYVLPLIPMLAVTAGVGFAALPRVGRRVVGLAVAAAALFQVSASAFAMPSVPSVPWIGTLAIGAAPPDGALWPHRAIFEAIVKDGGRAGAASVIANHAHFSPSNFRYYALRDGLPLHVVRAWEGEPLGVEYMILKTGDLGPAWSVDKAQKVLERLAADRSLSHAFPLIAEFPLPDGSVASVRARRLAEETGVTADELTRGLADGLRARVGEFARNVQGLEVRVDHDARILRGHVTRLEIAAAVADLAEWRRRQPASLRVHDLRVAVDGALVNPASAREGRFDPLDAGRLTIERATVDAADLRQFLGRVKGLRPMAVKLGGGFVDLAFPLPGPDVAARVRLVSPAEGVFGLAADRVTVGGVPLPPFLVDWVMRGLDPARGLAGRIRVPLAVGPITVTPAAVRIGGA
jgi:4-amino-4-deoxy-L-arabinose transferase-like glycosyltransferase